MALICIECSLIAMRDGKPLPRFDEEPDEHMRRVHPNGGLQGVARLQLERDAAAALDRRIRKAGEN